MTALYRSVLIESAEQAEALPEGTLARHAVGPGMDHAHKVRPLGRDLWLAVGGNCTNAEMVGWTALMPIEAEEEWGEQAIAEGEFISIARLVTPWEEA